MSGHLFGAQDAGRANDRKDFQKAVRARLDRERAAEAKEGQAAGQQSR